MGKPLKLTQRLKDTYFHAIRLGASQDLAAKAAGVSPNTIYNWQKKGGIVAARLEQIEIHDGEEPPPIVLSDEEKLYYDFFIDSQQAEGEAAVGWLQTIEDAAQAGNWFAAAWKLERRHPETYGKNVVSHQGLGGKSLETTIRVLEVRKDYRELPPGQGPESISISQIQVHQDAEVVEGEIDDVE